MGTLLGLCLALPGFDVLPVMLVLVIYPYFRKILGVES